MTDKEKIDVEKVTVNMGVGSSGENLNKAQKLLERITGKNTVKTRGKTKVPQWGVREGKALGVKTTLRNKEAEKFLERAFEAVGNQIERKNFDEHGNLNFGIEEYIDIPGIEYDADIGMYGMDVNVTMKKWGYRTQKRKKERKKVPEKHRLTPQDSINYLTDKYELEVKE